MVQTLGADHALVKQILAGKSPAERAAELVAGTKMGDAATRKRCWPAARPRSTRHQTR